MKKLNKIFSVVLTAAIMTSLLITSAIPVSAGTQKWSEFDTPSTDGMVLDTTIGNASAFAQSLVDGALYASVEKSVGMVTAGAPGDGSEARIEIMMPAGTTLGDINSIAWAFYAMTGSYPPHVDITLATTDPNQSMLTAEYAVNYINGHAGIATVVSDMTAASAYETWLWTFELTAGDTYDAVGPTSDLWFTKMGGGTADAPWQSLADWQAGNAPNNPGTDVFVLEVNASTPVLKLEIEVDDWIATSDVLVKDIMVDLGAGPQSFGADAELLKSTDGGRSWEVAATLAAPAVAIVPSATEANVIFMADATTLYKSMDGGETWTTIVEAPPGDLFTALDVATFGGRYIAVLGTNNASGSNVGVFFWDSNDVFNNLNPVGTTTFGEEVLALKMAPTFAVDRAVVAVGFAKVRVNVNGGAWGATIADNTSIAAGSGVAADIAFPTDFNAVTNPLYFVVTEGWGVFRMSGGTALNVDAGTTLNNIDVFGAFNTGTAQILVGGSDGAVIKSTNSSASFTAVTLRSVAAAQSFVLFDKDYATNQKAFVLNATEALNVSIDGMMFFNQWSLVNETGIINGMDMAGNGDIYARTSTDTLWRYFGGVWERIGTGLNTNDSVFVSPNYVTDKTVMLADMGNNTAVWVSGNNGNKFTAMLSAPGSFDGTPNVVRSVFVVDNSTVIVGSDAGIITRNSSPFFWAETDVFGGSFVVTDIQVASNGDILAVAADGTDVAVAVSADNGATWDVLEDDLSGTAAVTAPAFITAANDYATTGNYFVNIDSSVFNKSGDEVATLDSAPSTGIVAAPGMGNSDEGNGVIYAAGDDEAIERVRGIMKWSDSIADAAGDVVQLFVTVEADGNKLWALIEDGTIRNYTDTLAKGITGVAATDIVSTTSLFFGIPTTSNTATVSFDTLANVTTGGASYKVFVNTTKQTDLNTASNAAGVTVGAVTIADGKGTANLSGMAADTTYYVSVWVDKTKPVSSFMGTTSFTTVVGTPTPAMNLSPAGGATNVPVKPTFDWADVPGAVSYEVWVDTNADFSTAVKATTPISAYAWTGADLANDTSYYWQVRAVTGSGTSGWVTSVFTTELAPADPVTVTTPAQPDITLTQLPAPDQETPGYIWIIIAIGGILTVLVIVLIVRTRRVV